MWTASAEHKIVKAELIKNICRKNSEGNKIEDIWERYSGKIFYMESSYIHPFGVGNGKLSLKVPIFSHS